MTALSQSDQDFLNRMNNIAFKTELGAKLADALTVTSSELSITADKALVGSSAGAGREVDPKFLAVGTFEYSDQPLDGAATLLAAADVLPDNAIITKAWYDVVTTFTSDDTTPDSTTIGIGVETVGAGSEDLINAVAINDGGNPWDAGIHAAIPVGSAATMIKTSAAKNITVNVVNAAGVTAGLTAGKLKVYVEYVLSE